MRQLFARTGMVAAASTAVASAEVVLLLGPNTVQINQPTVMTVAVTTDGAHTPPIDRFDFDFAGQGRGASGATDSDLVLSEFRWAPQPSTGGGACSSDALPSPYNECGVRALSADRRLWVASLTVMGARLGTLDLAPNLTARSALDGSIVDVVRGDPLAIEVIPEPPAQLLLLVCCGLCRRRGAWARLARSQRGLAREGSAATRGRPSPCQ